MTDEDEKPIDWAERADELDDAGAADHAYSASLAVLQTLPFGGGIAQLLSDYIPARKQQRLVTFVEELAREWQAHRDRMDEEFVRSDEFDALAEDVIERVQQVRSRSKQQYFAAILAGFATIERPDESVRQRMLDALDAMHPRQMELLSVAAATNEPPPNLYMGSGMATLKWKMPEWSEEAIREAWGELQRLGLLSDFPGATMTAQGAGNLQARMTPFGHRFVEFIRTTD